MRPYLQNIVDSIPEKWSEQDKNELKVWLNFYSNHVVCCDILIDAHDCSPENEELLKELERVFPDGGSTTETCLVLSSSIPALKEHVAEFLSTFEIREDWRSLPLGFVLACRFHLIGSPEGAYFVLPALLKAHLLSYSHSGLNALFSAASKEAKFTKKHLSLLNQEQRDFVQKLAQNLRKKRDKVSLLALLPWEWTAYAKKAATMRPNEWIRQSYPELELAEIESNDIISKIRAVIPSSWDERTRDNVAVFLDRIESALESYKQEEQDEARKISPEEKDLIQRIKQAFAGVSDEGTERLLLAGEADDAYMPDYVQELLSKYEIRGNWQNIPPEWLYACGNALSYMDAVGYRYLVPAFICAELHSYQIVDMVICLSASEGLLEHCAEKFSLFNEEQKAVVVDYMNIKRGQDSVTMDMALLLPWEMMEYQQQSEYAKASAWLRAKYPCLCKKNSNPQID